LVLGKYRFTYEHMYVFGVESCTYIYIDMLVETSNFKPKMKLFRVPVETARSVVWQTLQGLNFCHHWVKTKNRPNFRNIFLTLSC
jgi:hypothetical protein